MKKFNAIFLTVLTILALFGAILPYLLSQPSDFAVLTGGLIIISLFYLAGKFLVKRLTKGKE